MDMTDSDTFYNHESHDRSQKEKLHYSHWDLQHYGGRPPPGQIPQSYTGRRSGRLQDRR